MTHAQRSGNIWITLGSSKGRIKDFQESECVRTDILCEARWLSIELYPRVHTTHLNYQECTGEGVPASLKISMMGVPDMAQQLANLTSIHEDGVWSMASLSWLRIQCCHDLWCRSHTRLRSWLLWLWCMPASVAPIWPLAWESPYAVGVALKSNNNNRNNNNNNNSSLKVIGEFGFLVWPFSLLDPAMNCWTFLHHNLVSIDLPSLVW